MSPSLVAPWLRTQIAKLEPTAPLEIEPLTQTVARLTDRPRFETALVSFFAGCGLLLAAIGLYGVIAFIAAQRTLEAGIRMVLAAARMDILRLIAGEGLRLIALGGILGLGTALAEERLLRGLLFDVPPYDPKIYIAVTLLLVLVASVATLIPARSAMRVEPAMALRSE